MIGKGCISLLPECFSSEFREVEKERQREMVLPPPPNKEKI